MAVITDSHDNEIVHRELDTDSEEPTIEIAEMVVDLEGTPAEELPPTYDRIGRMLSGFYLNPPAPAAQMTIEFTYCGYRITVEQSGAVEFDHIT